MCTATLHKQRSSALFLPREKSDPQGDTSGDSYHYLKAHAACCRGIVVVLIHGHIRGDFRTLADRWRGVQLTTAMDISALPIVGTLVRNRDK